jgi:hypothetical protein
VAGAAYQIAVMMSPSASLSFPNTPGAGRTGRGRERRRNCPQQRSEVSCLRGLSVTTAEPEISHQRPSR